MSSAAPEQFLFQKDTRTPSHMPPPGSTDTQMHVFSDSPRYPIRPDRVYEPIPEATFEAAQRMHKALGLDRGVIVHTPMYSDYTLLVDCLAQNPNYRGTVVIDDSVSDATLQELHRAGVRGIRFNFTKRVWPIPPMDEFERSVKRAAGLGWHIKIRSQGGEFLEHAPAIRKVTDRLDVPIVIDHMGHLDFRLGVDQPALKLIVDRMKNGNWWVLLSNPGRWSSQGFPWDDSIPFAQAYIAADPNRLIWGTDWPHIRYNKPVPNDADLLELLYRWAPDAETQKKILVDNPAVLYDFD